MGKWAWRAVVGKNELWLEIVRSVSGGRHGSPGGVDMLRPRRPITGWWGDVLSSLVDQRGDWFEQNLRRVVGTGEYTYFWFDAWSGPATLQSLFPRFFSRCRDKSCSVAKAGEWEGDLWRWKMQWISEFRASDSSSLLHLINILECRKVVASHCDYWKWELENEGGYTAKSSYNFLVSRKWEINQSLAGLCNLLWRNDAVLKAKAIAWRILFRKVATRVELRRRGVLPHHAAVLCGICGNQDESVAHLFFECKAAADLWAGCLEWSGVQAPLANMAHDHLPQFCNLMLGKGRRSFLAMLWVCVVWTIWKERNSLVFKGGEWRRDSILGEIKSFMWAWGKSSKLLPKPDKSFRQWSICPW